LDRRWKCQVHYGSPRIAADNKGVEYYKFKGKVGNELTLVLGFDGSEYSYRDQITHYSKAGFVGKPGGVNHEQRFLLGLNNPCDGHGNVSQMLKPPF
jgi:hypothetical protein